VITLDFEAQHFRSKSIFLLEILNYAYLNSSFFLPNAFHESL